MIPVFFSAGGSARIACIRLSSPPPNFPDSFFVPGRKGCSIRRLPVATSRTCVLVVHPERRASMTRSEAPLIFWKAPRPFSRVSATLPRTSAMLSGPNFLPFCKGPIFLHFNEWQFLFALLRVGHAFAADFVLKILGGTNFLPFFSIIVECLMRVQLHGTIFLPGSDVHSTNWFSNPVWGHMLA